MSVQFDTPALNELSYPLIDVCQRDSMCVSKAYYKVKFNLKQSFKAIKVHSGDAEPNDIENNQVNTTESQNSIPTVKSSNATRYKVVEPNNPTQRVFRALNALVVHHLFTCYSTCGNYKCTDLECNFISLKPVTRYNLASCKVRRWQINPIPKEMTFEYAVIFRVHNYEIEVRQVTKVDIKKTPKRPNFNKKPISSPEREMETAIGLFYLYAKTELIDHLDATDLKISDEEIRVLGEKWCVSTHTENNQPTVLSLKQTYQEVKSRREGGYDFRTSLEEAMGIVENTPGLNQEQFQYFGQHA